MFRSLFFALLLAGFAKGAFAQSATCKWVGTTLNASLTGSLTASPASAGSGVQNFEPSTLYNNYSAKGWSSSYGLANSGNDFFQFTLQPSTPNGFQLNSLSFNHQWSSSSTVGYFMVYYSTDGFATRTQLGGTNPTPVNSTDGITVNSTLRTFTSNRFVQIPSGSSLSVRVYIWSSNADAYFRLDNMTLSGTTSPVVLSEGLNNAAGSLNLAGGQYFSSNSSSTDSPALAAQFAEGSHSYGVSNGVAEIRSANINTLGGTNLSLIFRLAGLSIGSTTNGLDADDSCSVLISSDGGATWWNTLEVIGNNNAFWSFGSGIGLAETAYDGNTIPVLRSPSAGGSRTTLGTTIRTDGFSNIRITNLPASTTFQFRIRIKNNSINERWLVDQIQVLGSVQADLCPAPENLAVNPIGTTSATLNWAAVPNSTAYNVEWRLNSGGSLNTVNGLTTLSTEITGLQSSTSYAFRVQGFCNKNLGIFSPWFIFNTTFDGICQAPTNLVVSNISSNTANISWFPVSGATSYQLQWRPGSGSTFISQTGITATSFSLTGLNPSTAYTVQVLAVCGPQNTSLPSVQLSFNTLSAPACGTPTGLATSSLLATSAQLSWAAVSGASAYNLQWKPNSSSTFTTVSNLTQTTFSLTGLTASTGYTFQVQALCSGNTGSFSAPIGFSTQAAGSPNEVIYLWMGALQPASATVVAKLTNESTTCRAVFSTSTSFTNPIFSSFASASAANNRMAKMNVTGLQPNTQYFYAVESNGVLDNSSEDIGRFRTPASGPSSFSFTMGSCSSTGNHGVYGAMQNKNPLFFLQTGDFHYRDPNSSSVSAHRTPYETDILSPSPSATFLKNTALVHMWDDHDYCGNNRVGSNLTGTASARQAYQEYIPHYPLVAGSGNVPIYQAFTIGRVRFLLTDLRSLRTSSSMFGVTQKAWFYQQCLQARDNCQMIAWITGTMFSGDLSDNWGGFPAERTELSNWFRDNNIRNMMIFSGDAHMVAIDNGTNNDFSTGNNNPNDYPVFSAAALNNGGSDKGGVWSQGKFANPSSSNGQYGLVDVTDNGGSTISITFRAFRTAGGTSISESQLVSYSFTRNLCTAPGARMAVSNLALRPKDDGTKLVLAWDIALEPGHEVSLKKSADGINFQTLTKTDQPHGSALDADPFSGWNHYQVEDANGNVIATNKLFVKGKGEIRLYPNPAKTNLMVSLEGYTGKLEGKYILYNQLRRMVKQDEFELEDKHQLSIPLAGLQPGYYILYFYANGMTSYKSILVE